MEIIYHFCAAQYQMIHGPAPAGGWVPQIYMITFMVSENHELIYNKKKMEIQTLSCPAVSQIRNLCSSFWYWTVFVMKDALIKKNYLKMGVTFQMIAHIYLHTYIHT